jgi:hypothetical protein
MTEPVPGALEFQLRTRLKKEPVNLEEFRKATELAYVLNPSLLINGHFELKARALIKEPLLGVLGVVQHIETAQNAEESLRRYIDQATYLRRLLLQTAGRIDRRAYSVELVIDSSSTHLHVMGELLRKISRDTDFLYHIGLHLTEPDGSLGQSLCWLMEETRSWLPKPGEGPGVLQSIELYRYRLGARRIWNMDPKARVHVVHGHNGTGKSALTESIELVMTGTAERLKNKPNLGEIIWPRSQPPATKITLNYRDGRDPLNYEVNQGLKPAPLAEYLCGDSFRLDQRLMDRLARMDPARRAETFLTAYFPGQRPIFVEAAAARLRVDNVVAQLPNSIRKDLESKVTKDTTMEKLLISRFKWTEETSAPVPHEAQLDCLPLPINILRGLVPLNKSLAETIDNLEKKEMSMAALIPELNRLDSVLKPLAGEASQILLSIGAAKEALLRIRDWTPPPASGSVESDFEAQLDEWLELEALVDLATKHLGIADTLAQAKEKGWAAEPWLSSFASVLPNEKDLVAQRTKLKEWTDRHTHLLEIMASRSTPASGDKPGPNESFSITPNELSALDKAGTWLFEVTDREGLGKTIDDALRKKKAMVFGTLTIGGTDWSGHAFERLSALEKVVNEFWQQLKEKPMFGGDLLNLFKSALVEARASEKKGTEMSEIFRERISGKLNAALNELMALFAPARWAYKGLAIEQSVNTGTPEINLRTDGADATSRLNTAELNLFTVALFVLCAFSQRNPLQLLLLDDPLQNMDELTVTTLARGLGRLVRLMPPGWNLVFLFHGEDDLERFRRELPCAVYRLPWLSPSTDETRSIPIDTDRYLKVPDHKLQDLSTVLSGWTQAAGV